jgi:hypothetical protein
VEKEIENDNTHKENLILAKKCRESYNQLLHNGVSFNGCITKRCLHFLVLYRTKWVILESYFKDESNKFKVFLCRTIQYWFFGFKKVCKTQVFTTETATALSSVRNKH